MEIKEVARYKAVIRQMFEFDDWQAIDIFLAVVASHKVQGNMLWVRIVGPSGSGKSEMLRSLEPHTKYCISADTFTPGAIRGGLKREGTTERMLDLWNGKLVLTKDFASILSKHAEDRGEVFGLIRNAWDGSISAFFGSEDAHVQLKFHFDWLLATTPYIERQRSLEAELGTRFVDLRWHLPDNEVAAIAKACNKDAYSADNRKRLADAMGEFIAVVRPEPLEEDIWIPLLAKSASTLRTPIYRDALHQISDIPSPELGTRLAMGLQRVAVGLRSIGIDDYRPHLIRLALDCLPQARRAVAMALVEDEDATQTAIGKKVGIPQSLVSQVMEEFEILGISVDDLEIFVKPQPLLRIIPPHNGKRREESIRGGRKRDNTRRKTKKGGKQ